MELLLERNQYLKDRTLGVLYYFSNGVRSRFCDTLEDPNRDLNFNGKFDVGETKVLSETCIPHGRFKVELNMSPKFKRILPILLNVPNFTGIRIHRGNTPADSSGCILVGKLYKDVLVDSAKTEVELIEFLQRVQVRAEEIWIEIKKADDATVLTPLI